MMYISLISVTLGNRRCDSIIIGGLLGKSVVYPCIYYKYWFNEKKNKLN